MNKELKKAIVNYMFDNATEFQLINATNIPNKESIVMEVNRWRRLFWMLKNWLRNIKN